MRGARAGTVPVSVMLDGEYGVEGVVLGVPAHLGPGGLVSVAELRLTEAERTALHAAAEAIRTRLSEVEGRYETVTRSLVVRAGEPAALRRSRATAEAQLSAEIAARREIGRRVQEQEAAAAVKAEAESEGEGGVEAGKARAAYFRANGANSPLG